MEMLERCPGCSKARQVEPEKAESRGESRPCSNCGYDGPFPPAEREVVAGRDSLPSFAGARAKLATATQDLFRLSGTHSIPVEAKAASERPVPSSSEPMSSGRKAEASMMFSLEALMKANQAPAKPTDVLDEASNQLWSMQAATPLFGTSHDQALLTTPLKMEPAQSMDSMTLPSHAPSGRRWWPILVAAGLALGGVGFWFYGTSPGAAPASLLPPSSEQAALIAQPTEPEVSTPSSAAVAAIGLGSGDPEPAKSPEPVAAAADPALAASGEAPATAGLGVTAPNAAAPDGSRPAASAAPTAAVRPDASKDKPSSKKPLPRAIPTPPSAPKPFALAFDKNAAKTVLNDAAAQAASCGAGGSPGKGKMQVTFAPSGKVSDAQIVEGAFAGTTAGKCALRHFRAAKVPAFSGAPITVAKSFKVD